MTEGIEAVKEAKEFIEKNKPALIVNRVPKKALALFKELAREEFESDYGMCLKWLLDFYFGFLGKGSERAEALANEALEQINALRAEKSEGQEKTIRTVSGKEIKVK